MQPNVPIPTDSYHKFLATFGLALIISSLIASVFVTDRANDKIIAAAYEAFEYELEGKEVPQSLQAAIERRVEVASSDRTTFTYALGSGLAVGVILSFLGFSGWRKLQPLHDELLELQVAKARKEVHGDLEPHSLAMKPPPETKEPAISTRFKKWRANRKAK